MSLWRKEAIEMFPEARADIEKAENPTSLWIVLWSNFLNAHAKETFNEDLIRRTYQYGEWCVTKHLDSDILSAAVAGFYESLPIFKQVVREMPRWVDERMFREIEDALRYHLSEEEFLGFREGYQRKRKELGKT